MAKVIEIQICGGKIATTLKDACEEFLSCVDETDREKIHFTIRLNDGTTKAITFRQMGDGVHVYGDFKGMKNALNWARELAP